MKKSTMPAFPYGAVYFRKSNPPEEDWARDNQTAAEDGMTAGARDVAVIELG